MHFPWHYCIFTAARLAGRQWPDPWVQALKLSKASDNLSRAFDQNWCLSHFSFLVGFSTAVFFKLTTSWSVFLFLGFLVKGEASHVRKQFSLVNSLKRSVSVNYRSHLSKLKLNQAEHLLACTTASQLPITPTPNCWGLRKGAASAATLKVRHVLVSLRKLSPTVTGLRPLSFFLAMNKFAPQK